MDAFIAITRIRPWLILITSLFFVGWLSPLYGSSMLSGGDLQNVYKPSYLHVDGSRLIAANGREVKLRGINIGGWLVTESWMCGFVDSKDTKEATGSAGLAGRSALDSLEDRFGPEKAAALMNTWQDHWITARDLDQIQNAGFNLIRIPISYRTLQHADGSWVLDSHGQIDFNRMDWVVREAAKRGIYTIFDLHVWPSPHIIAVMVRSQLLT